MFKQIYKAFLVLKSKTLSHSIPSRLSTQYCMLRIKKRRIKLTVLAFLTSLSFLPPQ